MNDDPTDQERYPTLGDAGRRMLEFLREHPCAPIYRNQSGNRLTAEDISQLRVFEREMLEAPVGWPVQGRPAWLDEFVARTFEDVPFFRALGSPPARFEDLPTVTRGDFAADITKFVPDSVDVARLINYRTTGTTGQPLQIASHPMVAGRYLSFHKRALQRFGIQLQHGAGQVGVVLLGYQRTCFTYVSVTPTMGESGLAKINLHPDDWRSPEHPAQYLDALAPEIVAGDPISFAALLALPTRIRPRAMLSVAMVLSKGLCFELERRFECPVLDIYSLNEVGPVSVFDAGIDGYLLLQPKLYVEILDPKGTPVPRGARGEITLSGGFNFCLPLLRYRTGDYASLIHTAEGPAIIGLSGRRPVRFRTAAGEWINNIDVSHALEQFALPQFGLHQHADGRFRLRLARGSLSQQSEVCSALARLLGTSQVEVETIIAEDKIVQYTSDLEGASI